MTTLAYSRIKLIWYYNIIFKYLPVVVDIRLLLMVCHIFKFKWKVVCIRCSNHYKLILLLIYVHLSAYVMLYRVFVFLGGLKCCNYIFCQWFSKKYCILFIRLVYIMFFFEDLIINIEIMNIRENSIIWFKSLHEYISLYYSLSICWYLSKEFFSRMIDIMRLD